MEDTIHDINLELLDVKTVGEVCIAHFTLRLF